MPERVQLRRAKGWKMPPNTVKVDRTTKWGNPFVTGKDGDSEACVQWFACVLGGMVVFGCRATPAQQQSYYRMAVRDRAELRGKNLACWCRAGAKCHADVLLEIANRPAVTSNAQIQGRTRPEETTDE